MSPRGVSSQHRLQSVSSRHCFPRGDQRKINSLFNMVVSPHVDSGMHARREMGALVAAGARHPPHTRPPPTPTPHPPSRPSRHMALPTLLSPPTTPLPNISGDFSAMGSVRFPASSSRLSSDPSQFGLDEGGQHGPHIMFLIAVSSAMSVICVIF